MGPEPERKWPRELEAERGAPEEFGGPKSDTKTRV